MCGCMCCIHMYVVNLRNNAPLLRCLATAVAVAANSAAAAGLAANRDTYTDSNTHTRTRALITVCESIVYSSVRECVCAHLCH